MAKVLKFPAKKELPKDVEEHLHKIAKDYIGVLNDVVDATCVDLTDEKEYSEMLDLMLGALFEGIFKAINELNES